MFEFVANMPKGIFVIHGECYSGEWLFSFFTVTPSGEYIW